MTMPTKAFLVIGLLLTSGEAWAQGDTIIPIEGDGKVQRLPGEFQSASLDAMAHRLLPPVPARRGLPNDSEDHIRSAQGKGPVDVLSLSLGGALACFFVIAMIRRRKSRIVGSSGPRVDLPSARALTSGERTDSDPSGYE